MKTAPQCRAGTRVAGSGDFAASGVETLHRNVAAVGSVSCDRGPGRAFLGADSGSRQLRSSRKAVYTVAKPPPVIY